MMGRKTAVDREADLRAAEKALAGPVERTGKESLQVRPAVAVDKDSLTASPAGPAADGPKAPVVRGPVARCPHCGSFQSRALSTQPVFDAGGGARIGKRTFRRCRKCLKNWWHVRE